MPSPSKSTVVFADDHDLIREALRGILSKEYRVLQEVSDGRALVEAVAELSPSFVVLDISMPHLDGLEAARQIRRRSPKMPIIFVTMQTRHEYVSECFRAGALGYVLKTAATKELPIAVRDALSGIKYVSSELKFNPLDCIVGKPQFAELTDRQRQVLTLVAEGHSAKKIGEMLDVTRKTVEFHKARIQASLGLRSTGEMIRYAVSHDRDLANKPRTSVD